MAWNKDIYLYKTNIIVKIGHTCLENSLELIATHHETSLKMTLASIADLALVHDVVGSKLDSRMHRCIYTHHHIYATVE